MKFKRIGLILITSCVAIFTWELVALKQLSQFKPSVGITFLANQSYRTFSQLGRGFAWLSSYLTIVELHDLYRAAEDLLRPIGDLLASPLAFINGYLEIAMGYKYPIIIGLGSSILLAVGVYAVPRVRSWWRRRGIPGHLETDNAGTTGTTGTTGTADTTNEPGDSSHPRHRRRRSVSN
jgi:hypothetical protein